MARVQVAAPHYAEAELIHFGTVIEQLGMTCPKPLKYECGGPDPSLCAACVRMRVMPAAADDGGWLCWWAG